MGTTLLFHIDATSGVPIYRQLHAQVIAMRDSGRLAPGDFLPSARDLAAEMGISPMTVSKAWSRLRQDRVVEVVRGQGMRATASSSPTSQAQRVAAVRALLKQVVDRAHQLQIPRDMLREELDRLLARTPSASA